MYMTKRHFQLMLILYFTMYVPVVVFLLACINSMHAGSDITLIGTVGPYYGQKGFANTYQYIFSWYGAVIPTITWCILCQFLSAMRIKKNNCIYGTILVGASIVESLILFGLYYWAGSIL